MISVRNKKVNKSGLGGFDLLLFARGDLEIRFLFGCLRRILEDGRCAIGVVDVDWRGGEWSALPGEV